MRTRLMVEGLEVDIRITPDAKLVAFRSGLLAVEQLIACTKGVVDLQGDGQLIPWADYKLGGPHAHWLEEFHAALSLIDAEERQDETRTSDEALARTIEQRR